MHHRREFIRAGALGFVVTAAGCSTLDDGGLASEAGEGGSVETDHKADADLGDVPDGWPSVGADGGASSTVAAAPPEWPVPAWGSFDRADDFQGYDLEPAIIANGTILFSPADHVAAYDLDGEPQWELPSRFGTAQVTAAAGDTAFGVADDQVVAVSVEDGSEYWRFTPVDGGRGGDRRLSAGPAVDGDVVYAPGTVHPVHALDAASGEVLWSYEPEGDGSADHPGTSVPTVIGDEVFVASGEQLHSVGTADGDGRWTTSLGDGQVRSAVVDGGDGSLYAATADRTGSGAVHAIDRDGGDEEWRETFDAAVTRPAVTGDLLVFGVDDRLVAVETDAAEPTVRWSVDLEGRIVAPPTIVEEAVCVVVDHDGRGEIAYLRLDDSERITSGWIEERPYGQPLVAGDRTFVTSVHGIVAFEDGGAPGESDDGEWTAHGGGPSQRHSAGTAPTSDPEIEWVRTAAGLYDPLLVDGRAYVANGGVDAIDTATGDLIWRRPLGRVVDRLATDGRRIFYSRRDDPAVVAVDPADGTIEWEHELEEEPRTGPVLDDEPITTEWDGEYVETDERLVVIDADEISVLNPGGGEEIARKRGPRSVGFLATYEGYVLTNPNGWGTVSGIWSGSGDITAEAYTDADFPGRGPAVGEDGDIYVAQNGGAIYSFQWGLRSFDSRWVYEPSDPANNVGDPVLGDDRVYVPYSDGTTYAVDRADGSLAWTHDAGSEGSGALAVADDALYMGGDGTLLCVDAATGDERWTVELAGEDRFGAAVEPARPTAVAVGREGLYVNTRNYLFKIADP